MIWITRLITPSTGQVLPNRFLSSFPRLGVFDTSHKEFLLKLKPDYHLETFHVVLLQRYITLLCNFLQQWFWKIIIFVHTASKHIGLKSYACCIARSQKGFRPMSCRNIKYYMYLINFSLKRPFTPSRKWRHLRSTTYN